jgi:HD-GYP domain-containing protein (c-di-GMP phosphodiesterase class II)
MWGILTSERFGVRAGVTALACAIVGVGLVEAVRLATNREATVGRSAPTQMSAAFPPPVTGPSTKEFTNRTPRELLAFYENVTPLQGDSLIAPFKGLWIRVAGSVETVVDAGGGGVTATFTDHERARCLCRFERQWRAALSRLSKNDEISAVGRISEGQNGSTLYLVDCDLVESFHPIARTDAPFRPLMARPAEVIQQSRVKAKVSPGAGKPKKEAVEDEWDVFISHASEDKDAIARPLAEALRAKGLQVWYDEFALTVGDSLRGKIDQGLARSRFGVVILSPRFFEKHWPEKELNGLATREVDGNKVILPVWHGVGFKDVQQYSPILADRIAVATDKGLPYVIDKLLLAMPPSSTSTAETMKYVRNLEVLLEERTDELRSIKLSLERSYDITLATLGDALDLRNAENAGHSKRVTAFTIAIARFMGVPREQILMIARGVFLHDIGMMSIPDAILRKPTTLTEEERRILQDHAYQGYKMLKRVPFLAEASEIVYSHQERFDGTGYPRGLKGQQIPLGARIFSVADTLDAITSARPYRPAQSIQAAREEIERSSGKQFDPDIVSAFLSIPEKVWRNLRDEIDAQIDT